MEQPIVIGHIDIDSLSPIRSKHSSLTCDDCGCHCSSSFGDSRVKITTIRKDSPNEKRMICESCAQELFEDFESKPIFD